MPMTRHAVVQSFLSLYERPSYLEIGVSKGSTFHAVEAARKVAVDPKFRFDVQKARRNHPGDQYHEATSDDYFGSIINIRESFDVIYIDGLHTFEQTLRDFTNSLMYLASHGTIIIDDVFPSTHLASIRDREVFLQLRREMKASHDWMGDVYRLVYFIETFFQQLSFACVEENHGQAVVWREKRNSVPERRVEEIGRLPYESAVLSKEIFNFSPCATIVEHVSRLVRA